MSKDHNQKPLKEAIDSFLRLYRHDKKFQQIEIQQAWQQVMGSYISGKTRSLYFSESVLKIKLESSVIAEEIQFAKTKVISDLNSCIGRNLIEDLLFVD